MNKQRVLSDFDGTTIYPLQFAPSGGGDTHIQPNSYLPGHPDETVWQSSTRVHRHNLEAAINAGAGNRQHLIFPWIAAGNTCFCAFEEEPPHDPFPNNYTQTADDFHRTLELARQKDIVYLAIWLASYDTPLESYQQINAFFEQVYFPKLDSVSKIYAASSLEGTVEDLWTTLRNPSDKTLDQELLAPGYADNPLTIIQCDFIDLDDAPGTGIRINLECRVDSPLTPFGKVYICEVRRDLSKLASALDL